MGGSSWSDAAYATRSSVRAASGADPFAYDKNLRSSGSALSVHEKLDPSKPNSAGHLIRESRDSDDHPESLAIAVLFDVTGSMQGVPRVFLQKLGKLMSMLKSKGYVDHPQVLFGAIGDAYSDRVPLQLGQFESGLEMDDDLTRFVLEGGGGGQKTESYELAMYYMARHAALDCVEKRGKKGYLFILGDEAFYPKVSRQQVEKLIGDKLQDDISTADIVAELKAKFEVFFVQPAGTSHLGDVEVLDAWKSLLGQNVLRLDDANAVCEYIAGQIGLCEGKADIDSVIADLAAMGADGKSLNIASKALATYAKTANLATVAKVTGDIVPSEGVAASVERL